MFAIQGMSTIGKFHCKTKQILPAEKTSAPYLTVQCFGYRIKIAHGYMMVYYESSITRVVNVKQTKVFVQELKCSLVELTTEVGKKLQLEK